ncbi:TolB family protein [Streptomyces iconiensis]|uniref:WD40-like Beta Propeller Repeat n=1 Tax=Streptomyces iconiensis TaxID=1384038 RepID=A0ABT6ZTV7_9ACTN|nr:hypothetical protein [Streptomyces iconiensis]MDJ1132494.1 hypothetical protein [Streptomyces iconiensis]
MRNAKRAALGAALVSAVTATFAVPALAAPGDTAAEKAATPRTERISVAADGTEANGPSREASVSRDGTLAVFTSEASNLVAGDDNGAADIFVKTLASGKTERIAVAGRTASEPVLSADGKVVAFTTEDGGGDRRVHTHDLATGKTEQIKTPTISYDVQGRNPAISADGKYVAFIGTPPPGEEENAWIYLKDREGGGTRAFAHSKPDWQDRTVSDLTMDDKATRFSYRYNFTTGPRADCCDVFVRDLTNSALTQLDGKSTSDQQRGRDSTQPVTTADGRFVTFQSGDDGLVPGDNDKAVNAFVWNAETGKLRRVPGRHGKGSFSRSPVPSPDGKALLYAGEGTSPTYLLDLTTSAPARQITPNPAGNYVETTPHALSNAAKTVAYATPDALTTKDTNEDWDIYVAHA